jgi:hypothetical protein
MPSKRLRPGTWAVVLGTIMVVLAIFDAMWGLASVVLGEQLQVLAGQLDQRKLGMAFGRIVHFITFGFFTLSGSETGEHARHLLAMLPGPGYLVHVGWIRVSLSIVGAILGLLLAKRVWWSPGGTLVWVVVAILWSMWSTQQTWHMTAESLGDPMQGESLPMFTVEMGVHFVWPIVLGIRCVMWMQSCRRASQSGGLAQ